MSRRLVVASANKGKIAELTQLLADFPVEVVGLNAYPEAPELPEPYDTFAANAESKALAAAEFTDTLALADDSGLEVEALGGRPGVLSARYADSDSERIAKLLAELQGLEGAQRRARFVCVIALATPGKLLGLWREACEGAIATQPRGEQGFGFDPIFLHGNRAFAELSSEEKNAVSHRGKAMRAFRGDFGKLLASMETE